MTKFVRYSCDRCNQNFQRDEVIEWGFNTHYCRQCAKLEINDLLKTVPRRLARLTYERKEGMDALGDIYDRIMKMMVRILERESVERPIQYFGVME